MCRGPEGGGPGGLGGPGGPGGQGVGSGQVPGRGRTGSVARAAPPGCGSHRRAGALPGHARAETPSSCSSSEALAEEGEGRRGPCDPRGVFCVRGTETLREAATRGGEVTGARSRERGPAEPAGNAACRHGHPIRRAGLDRASRPRSGSGRGLARPGSLAGLHGAARIQKLVAEGGPAAAPRGGGGCQHGPRLAGRTNAGGAGRGGGGAAPARAAAGGRARRQLRTPRRPVGTLRGRRHA